jgi:catechol 2,3-dioxygenase-like lactoylglutathione lyase family enzyme
MTRRDALTLFGAAAVCRAADETPLRFTNLDHVEFFATDVEKSIAFYARVFGNTVSKNNRTTRRYLKLGSAYIAIENAGANGLVVDHFCAGIAGFDVQKLHAYLMSRNIPYRDYPSGRDLAVSDPDGTRLQLAADKGWATIPGSPENIPIDEQIFQPLGIEHILINVSDQERAAELFSKILGPVTRRNNNRVWFQAGSSRIGLLKTPAGQKAGVNHYGVVAAKFDYNSALKKLAALGAKIEKPELEGAPEFRDPDGYLVQVMNGAG